MRSRAALILAICVPMTFAATAESGGPVPVKDGRYAGGGDRLQVWFKVQNRTIPFVRVNAERLEDCAFGGPAVFDTQVVAPDGRFKLTNDSTFAGNSFVVRGRFVSRSKVKGSLKWTTTSDCPAGTYKFGFVADRFAPVQ